MWRSAILPMFVCALAMQALQQGHRAGPGDERTADPGWSELSSSIEKMHLAMASVAPSGDSDVDFARLMLPHHQAAIDMAKIQLLHGKDPKMRRLAQEIVTDQQAEIELMQLWLQGQGPGSPKAGQVPSPRRREGAGA